LISRIATRQALYVLFLALLCGVFSTIAQIYFDLGKERIRQVNSIDRFIYLHQSALSSSVYNLEKELADETLKSIVYNPMVSDAYLLDDFGDELGRATKDKDRHLSVLAKLSAQLINIPLEKQYTIPIDTVPERYAVLKIKLNEANLVEGLASRIIIIVSSTLLFTVALAGLILIVTYVFISRPIINISHWISRSKSPEQIECPPYLKKDELGFLVERFRNEWQANYAASIKLESLVTQLTRNEHFSRLLMENSSDAMFLCLPSSEIYQVNRQAKVITGLSNEALVGQYLASFSELYEVSEIQEILSRATNGQVIEYEDIYYHESSHYLECRVTVITLGSQIYLMVNVRDVTTRKLAEKQIYQLAYFDSLTNLANRRMLSEKLEHEIEFHRLNQKYGALLYFDLDRFKHINDSMGHSVGDSLLREIAQRMLKIAPTQSMSSRLGGDEFVLSLFQLSDNMTQAIDHTMSIAKELLSVLSEPFAINGVTLHSTCSIGICLFPDQYSNPSELLRCADTAMYRAKALGRNSIEFYKSEMQFAATKILQLEDELHQALTHNQLEVWLQPQVDVEKRLLGAEVLVRWNHPIKGMVVPDKFIPEAEESGLIIDIDKWVLKESIQILSQWISNGLPDDFQRLAINISPAHFQQIDFVSYIFSLLDESQVLGCYIELEITENLLLNNFNIAISKMEQLKTRGITFSIDDFGTGYSSLKYLNELPVEVLKIDRSFIQNLASTRSTQPIVEVVITTAKKLGMSVIAEGVETIEQVAVLDSLGCDKYQGYYFSTPVPQAVFLSEWFFSY